jgi:hypothetical protein
MWTIAAGVMLGMLGFALVCLVIVGLLILHHKRHQERLEAITQKAYADNRLALASIAVSSR